MHKRSLCIMCLQSGHFARSCPCTHLRCQKAGCNKEYNNPTPTLAVNVSSGGQSQPNPQEKEFNARSNTCGVESEGAAEQLQLGPTSESVLALFQ